MKNDMTIADASDRAVHLLILCGYLALCVALYGDYQYLNWKDEVNFIVIAERFARGDWQNAVNAYWHPALPLLLAGLLVAGMPSVLAAKILCVAIGVFTFFGVRALSYRFTMTVWVRRLVLLSFVPILLDYTYEFFGADILMVGLLAWYFSVIFHPAYRERRWAGWMCGASGALLFLTKGFGFMFFIAHFTLMTAMHAVLGQSGLDRRRVLLNFARGSLVFACVTVLWALALDQKYHDPAVWFGFTGKHAFTHRAPDVPPIALSTNAGLVAPPPGAVSIWEEPYYFYRQMPRWSPFTSLRGFKHQLKAARDSTVNIVKFYGDFTAFWGAIVAAALVLCMVPAAQLRARLALVCALASFLLYTGLYAVLYSYERYMWPMQALMLVMGGHVLTYLQQWPAFAFPRQQVVLALAFAVSFVWHPVDQLQRRVHVGKALYVISEQLRAEGVAGERYASNEDYGGSVVLAYLLGGTYYGHPKPGTTEHPSAADLRQHEIRYYFVWNPRSAPTDPAFQLVSTFSIHFASAFSMDSRHVALYAVR